MADRALAEAAAEALLARKEELAAAITEALYEERPELLERWGTAGRAKCLQDMRYNLEHLAPAVALASPTLFADYVRWLRAMLGARGIPGDDVRDSLRHTRAVVGARLAEEEARLVRAVLDAGMAEP